MSAVKTHCLLSHNVSKVVHLCPAENEKAAPCFRSSPGDGVDGVLLPVQLHTAVLEHRAIRCPPGQHISGDSTERFRDIPSIYLMKPKSKKPPMRLYMCFSFTSILHFSTHPHLITQKKKYLYSNHAINARETV